MRLGFALVLGAALSLAAVRPALAIDARELKAREAFVAGRYQEALDTFVKLYAETLHPNYLRNIGRCYQGMGEPDRAITSFRDYLHKAKGISADERGEIDGYIREMEDLKRRQEAAAAAPAPVTPIAAPPAAAPPPPPAAPEPRPAVAATLTTAPSPAPAESQPLYTRWWFWTAVGGAIGAGIAIAFATGAFSRTEDASCPTGRTCPN
jgi:tetratricopeptide (TPR) repeat protein